MFLASVGLLRVIFASSCLSHKLASNFPLRPHTSRCYLRPTPLHREKLHKYVTDVDSPSHQLADNDSRPSGPPMTFAQLTSFYRTLGVLLRRACVPRNRCDSLSRAAGSERLEV